MPATKRNTEPTTANEPLYQLLAEHNTPCPRCGYNLRGLTHPQCPQCAQPVCFDSLLKPKRMASLPWIITLIAWAAALPWSVFYVWQGLIVERVFDYGRGPNTDSASIANIWFDLSYGYWLSVPVIVLLLVLARRRFMRLPSWLRWSIALAATVLTLLAFRRWEWWYGDWYGDWYWWGGFWWLPTPRTSP